MHKLSIFLSHPFSQITYYIHVSYEEPFLIFKQSYASPKSVSWKTETIIMLNSHTVCFKNIFKYY